MPKKSGETFQQYKSRVMDPVSGSFCAAKWKNATIILNQGLTKSCHHPIAHKIPLKEVKHDPSSLHNTSEKMGQRKKMLEGRRPKGCDYCWMIEDADKDVVSDRIYKTEIYEDSEIHAIANASHLNFVNPETLEISFSRVCNFACSYCSSDYSTTWEKDICKFGGYKRLVTRDSTPYNKGGGIAQVDEDNNPFIKAFWDWFPSLTKDLKQLRITGGEPLMSSDVWKLIDLLALPENRHIKMAINTNLGANDQLINKLMEASKKLPHLEIYTSNESTGSHAEYIRDGLDYERWLYNCRKLVACEGIKQLHVMMTINSLCLYSITDLFDEILTWRSGVGDWNGVWSLNILRHPSFMSFLILPFELRRERASHIRSWLEKNKKAPMLEHEVNDLQRLIGYLEKGGMPHERAKNLSRQRMDFKTFFKQYDKRRGKSFAETFKGPLGDWYGSLKANTSILPEVHPLFKIWIG